jgi:hypothetical protein
MNIRVLIVSSLSRFSIDQPAAIGRQIPAAAEFPGGAARPEQGAEPPIASLWREARA